jgi:exosome complex component RRP42
MFIVDPILQEEAVLESKLTIAVRDDGKICAMQKQGSGTLEFAEVERMIDIAMRKSKELRGLL